MAGKAEEGCSNPYPKHSPIITPMTYKTIIIPQPIITPLPPAVAYLIGALGERNLVLYYPLAVWEFLFRITNSVYRVINMFQLLLIL